MTKLRTYSELSKLITFKDRYDYLRLEGAVGETTFGFDRYLNQVLYRSAAWLRARDEVIIRDNGCDLGITGFEIRDRILIHHMNPITVEDIKARARKVFDPEFLISTCSNTHLAIHYSNETLLRKDPIPRRPGDTRLWP